MLRSCACALFVLVSCSSESSPSPGPAKKSQRPIGLAGKYAVDIQRTFWPKDRPPRHRTREAAVKFAAASYEQSSFRLFADRTFEFVYGIQLEGKRHETACRGTWTREGDKITFDTTDSDDKNLLGARHGRVEGDCISFDTGSEIPPTIHLVRR